MTFSRLLDLTGMITAIISALLWYKASTQEIRRISRHEPLDALDMNRMITAMNRGQVLNRRAAIATAIAAAVAAIKFGDELFRSLFPG
jgi:hypothetical protein